MQPVLNLVDNALRHMPAGGRITLTAVCSSTAAAVSVSDTGPGIAPEHLPRLFERFCRADDARSRATGGVGLGLAICEWIARAHHGELSVRSEVGRGSVFTLPLASVDAPANAEAQSRRDGGVSVMAASAAETGSR
jgi:two-component system sensor histidine kinase BaeS